MIENITKRIFAQVFTRPVGVAIVSSLGFLMPTFALAEQSLVLDASSGGGTYYSSSREFGDSVYRVADRDETINFYQR